MINDQKSIRQINTAQAFSFFAEKILAGAEGIFWSEREVRGSESWVFGVGRGILADFAKGPFPFFSLTSFEGDKKYFLHFKEWYSSEYFPKSGLFPSPDFSRVTSLPDVKIQLAKELSSCSGETESSFCRKVEKVKKYSADGELWVLNLAHELSGGIAGRKRIIDHI